MRSAHQEGRTPLSWAAEKGHALMAALLMDSGALAGTKDNARSTLTLFICFLRHRFHLFIFYFLSVQETLTRGAMGHHDRFFFFLLPQALSMSIKKKKKKKKKKPMSRPSPKTADERSPPLPQDLRAPLHWAAFKSAAQVARLLLLRGADPSHQDRVRPCGRPDTERRKRFF